MHLSGVIGFGLRRSSLSSLSYRPKDLSQCPTLAGILEIWLDPVNSCDADPHCVREKPHRVEGVKSSCIQ